MRSPSYRHLRLPLPREILGRFLDIALDRVRAGSLSLAHGETLEPKMALSFDDGPSLANTPRLLDILRESGARATFFVVGEKIKGRETLLERMVADGHEVGNHTYTHPHTIRLTNNELRQEVERTNEAIQAVTQLPVTLIRPPFGKDRRRIAQLADALGMTAVLWSIDSGDTQGLSTTEIADRVLQRAKPGAIVLFHDGDDLRPSTLGGVEAVLRADDLSLEVTTVGEILWDSDGRTSNPPAWVSAR
jgi:peptidoglycan/xylan/chitin deacetylase (PgdA/CDA1 family)